MGRPESSEVVVLCHGYLAHKDHGVVKMLSQELPFNTVRFDFHGCGESSGHEAWSYGGYMGETKDDLRAVVLFLRSKGLSVRGVVGHSRGGNIVMLYAAVFDDVPLVVSLAARYDMSGGIVERFSKAQLKELEEGRGYFEIQDRGSNCVRRITKQSVADRKAIDMSVARNCTACRILTVHGTKDDTVPVEAGLAFDALLKESPGRHTLHLIDGASHSFVNVQEHAQNLLARVTEFLTHTPIDPPGPACGN
eukprot:GDKI01022672.1.p1 GENE.GDKI01022672.1~~GDKI01022672.1.p1  ORF type:complete len:250 (-),score=85.26 GDKI01022672.1:464-1213(-)